MRNKYIEFLHTHYDKKTADILQVLMENGYVDEIQTILNRHGARLVVDGILGIRTLNALLTTHIDMMLAELDEMLGKIPNAKPKTNGEKLKLYLMNYLAAEEGTVVHWNKGEYSFTTPYGVYAYSFPNAEVVQYVKSICLKYGYDCKRRDLNALDRVNERMTKAERKKIRDMAYMFYVHNFMNPKLNDIYTKHGAKKSYLSTFSMSVNAGMKRPAKYIQKTVGVTPDGKIGPQSLKAIDLYIKGKGDDKLNLGLLCKMARFYYYLANSRRSLNVSLEGGSVESLD